MQYRLVMSWGNACGEYMHHTVTSRADHVVAACNYCMGSKVSSLSQIYLYSSYFDMDIAVHHSLRNIFSVAVNILQKRRKHPAPRS
jgi:hypothetical protein